MSDNTNRERLIHVLLQEELGGDTAPDLLDRILARADTIAPPRPAKNRTPAWMPRLVLSRRAVLTLAAVLMLAAGGVSWFVWWQLYPAPTASGEYKLADSRELSRGTTFITQDAPATLTLGGYCHLDVQPQTTLRLEGQRRAEQVYLEKGHATFRVDRNIGEFAVRTDMGTVTVKGTEFTVRVAETEGENSMSGKTMWVRVIAGAVLMTGAWGQMSVAAGEEQKVQSGVVTGVVTAKAEGVLGVRAEGAQESERYVPQWVNGGPDKEIVRAIAALHVGDKVEIKWVFNERKRVTAIKVLAAAPGGDQPQAQTGSGVGVVTAKSGDGVAIRIGDGESQRYPVRMVNGAPDKEVMAALEKIKVGDKVEFKWVTVEQRKRLAGIRKVGEAGTQPTQPAQTGAAVGVLTAKSAEGVAIKIGDGESQRYPIRMVNGAPDKEVMAALEKIQVGDKVEFKWVTVEQRKRLAGIHKVGEAGTQPAAQTGIATGVISEKGDTWVRITSEGRSERYNARMIEGAPDKNVVRVIAELKAGDKVQIQWIRAEGLRIVKISRVTGDQPAGK